MANNSQLVNDYGHTLYTSWKDSGSTESFSDWLKKLKKESFDQSSAENYYSNINKYFSQFNSIYEYLEDISDRIGYKFKESLDIISDVQDRIQYIQKITGLDLDFLNQLFKVDELQNIVNNLLTYSSEGYIFAGEQFGQLPNHTAISELIGIKVSNGKNKTTIENFLLNKDNSLKFTKAMQESGKMVLMPTRDASGKIQDFNFGLKGTGRYAIRDQLLQITGGVSEQLPINYQDSQAVAIVDAILSGKNISIQNTNINFATQLIGANYGERSEALVEAIYKTYAQTQQPLSGLDLENIVNTQLIKLVTNKQGQQVNKFNIPAGTAGLASEDFILATFGSNQFSNIPVQNKNIGNSVRFSYGSVLGVQQINGFYAGRGLFNQSANKALSQGYAELQKNNQEEINTFSTQINTEFQQIFFNTLAGENIEVSGLEEGAFSKEEVIDMVTEYLTGLAI